MGWLTRTFIQIVLAVLFTAEIALSRTVTHRETTLNANGDKIVKTWTSSDDLDDEHPFQRRTVLQKDTTYHMQPHSEQSEILKFGATGIPNDELIRQATLRKGMDPVALKELLRTKQPVITTTTDESGRKRTTTYTLEPDGTIERKTTTEMKPMTFNAPPSSIEPYDEHFFDTFKSMEPMEPAEHVPISNTQRKPTFYSGPKLTFETEPWKDLEDDDTFIRKLKPLDTSKILDEPPKTHNSQEWVSPFYEHNSKPILLPESWNPKNWPNNNKPYFQRPLYNPDTDQYKDPFDGVETNTPGTITKTYVDDNGRTVTTTYTVGPTKVTRKLIKYPMQTFGDFPEWTSTTKKITTLPELATEPSTTQKTTTQTTNKNKPELLTTTPLPSLEDFLKNQYGKAKTTTTTTSKPFNTAAETTQNKPTHTLKVENIPISDVLLNGKPVDGPQLSNLPEELRPLAQNPSLQPNTFKVTNIPRQDSLETTSVKTINKTVRSHNLPTNADLDPGMQDMLKKAGIDPSDIKSIDGDTITKTRTEPDGRVITTTYKVRKVPSLLKPQTAEETPKPATEPRTTNPFFTRTPQAPHSSHSSAGSIFPTRSFPTYDEAYPTYNSPKPTFSFNTPYDFQPTMPETPFASPIPAINPIEQFLAKLGLTPRDLLAKNGEFSKTITDDRGRVLTVNFVLSTPIRDKEERLEHANSGQTQKPIK